MKRFYYTLQGTQPAYAISQDLTSNGIDKGQIHFLNKNALALDTQGVNRTNLFEEKDIGHSGIYGGMIGCVAGFVFNVYISMSSLSEFHSVILFFCILGLFTAFGTWAGGIVGISKENHHIEQFHDDIESGNTLLMIDAYDDRQEMKLKDVMVHKHKEASYRGEDKDYHEFL